MDRKHFSVHRVARQMLIVLLFVTLPAHAAGQRVIKVLPHLLDLKGRHAVSPSLFDRDAYQAWLRGHPEEQSGIRYDVQWRSREPGEFILKVELIGRVEQGQVSRKTIEKKLTLKRSGSRWSALEFAGDEFKEFGPIVAWRVSLWRGEEMVGKQQSFLWE